MGELQPVHIAFGLAFYAALLSTALLLWLMAECLRRPPPR